MKADPGAVRQALVARTYSLGYAGIRMYDGAIQFHSQSGSVTAGDVASNERMRIDSTGNVGIGTTNPSKLFEVDSTSTVAGYFKGPSAATELYIGNSESSGGSLVLRHEASNGIGGLRIWGDGLENGIVLQQGGNVGIGTSSPETKLHLVGTETITGGPAFVSLLLDSDSGESYTQQMFRVNGSYRALLEADDSGIFSIWTKGAGAHVRAMSIDSSGNVGIGTSNPDDLLDVRGGGIVLSDVDVAHGITSHLPTNVYGQISFVNGTSGGLYVAGISDASVNGAVNVLGVIGTTDPDDAHAAVRLRGGKSDGAGSVADLAPTETVLTVENNDESPAITVLGSGNVGIGVTSPTTALHIFDDTNAGTPSVSSSVNGLLVETEGDSGNTTYVFQAKTPSADFVVAEGGNVGIGTTSPAAKLDVTGEVNIASGSALRWPGALSAYIIGVDASHMLFGVNGNERMRIDSSGNIGIGNTNPGTKIDIEFSGTTVADGININNTDGNKWGLYSTGSSHSTSPNSFGIWQTSANFRFIINSSGDVGIGALSPTAKLDLDGSTGYNLLRLRDSYTPTGTADLNGNIGDIAWDNSYIYVKTGGGWARAALGTW